MSQDPEQPSGSVMTDVLPVRKCATCGLETANAVCPCNEPVMIAAQSQVGRSLGCYAINEILKQGKTGIIYKAHDQWQNRIVAIKVLRSHLVNDSHSLQRFNHEAKATGNIEHPNVITAFDFGVASDTKHPFLVMEYLAGSNLAELIEAEGQIETSRAIDIFIQACEAMAAVHAKNVLHRNLKPGHIMVVHTQDNPDFVKVLDFGFAKMLPATGNVLSQVGDVCGTPFYMSPEQFIGGTIDQRSDIYAMGCVMYEALTGKSPITADHILETMYKQLNEMPKPFAEIRPDLKIPSKLEAVVMRALEKDPRDRYKSMAEMREDLVLAQPKSKDRRPLNVKLQNKWTNVRRFFKLR
jgi:eukaryotic-like serine/threonine-protein kinase